MNTTAGGPRVGLIQTRHARVRLRGSLLVLLLLALPAEALEFKIGAGICVAPGGTYAWEIEYAGLAGVSETFITTDGKLTWTPARPHRDWRVRYSYNGSPPSEWSGWHPGEIFLGDADGDCIVGGPDVREIGLRWGARCP